MAKKPQKKKNQISSESKTRSTPKSRKSNLLFAHGGPRFTRTNYILMGIGLFVLVIGYILVSGGHQSGDGFNTNEIYSTTRITIAPILIILGFIIEIVAIFYKPKDTESTETEA